MISRRKRNTETTELADNGWYFVDRQVTINHGLTLKDDAHIILKDGATLTINAGDGQAGIRVRLCTFNDDDLYIYGQEKGTGQLIVNGGKNSAGIGGDMTDEKSCGNVWIHGGVVTATGGENAAGIGGGKGGEIYLYGGAGVVGGNNGAGGTVTIYGGTVTATGSKGGAGIGGGKGNNGVDNCPGGAGGQGGDVVVFGGVVEAVGSDGGAGIGGGKGSDFYSKQGGHTGSTTVSSGPGGVGGKGGSVTIYSGSVKAKGGESGVGIGGGAGGLGGDDRASWSGLQCKPGGSGGAGGSVDIYGGVVELSGAQGIGGGPGGAGGYWHNNTSITAAAGKQGENCALTVSGGVTETENGIFVKDKPGIGANMEVTGSFNTAAYIKIAEKGPTCTGGDIAKEDGVWVVKPTGNAKEVEITGLPTGDSVVVPPTVSKVTGADDGKIIVKSGTVDITGAFTITGGAIALNPEGKVNGVPVKPIIGKLDGEDAPATQPFTLGEGDAAVTVATIPGLVYELKLTTDLGTAFGTIRDGVKATGDGKPVTLTDTDPPKVRAFYIIDVSVP